MRNDQIPESADPTPLDASTNATGKSQIDPSPEDQPDPSPEPTSKEDSQAVGETMASLITNTAAVAGGSMWEPTPSEKKSLDFGCAAFLQERGIDRIPPKVSMIVGFAGYILPRFVAINKATKERKDLEAANAAKAAQTQSQTQLTPDPQPPIPSEAVGA